MENHPWTQRGLPKGTAPHFHQKNCTHRGAIFSLQKGAHKPDWILSFHSHKYKITTEVEPHNMWELAHETESSSSESCAWDLCDGHTWHKGIQRVRKKTSWMRTFWLHPRRFWSDLATAFSLWLGCRTTTIYIFKSWRTPILDFLKIAKSGSSMF